MDRTTKAPHNDPIGWLFRSRTTGKITIAQTPNLPLLVFLLAMADRLVLHPRGSVGVAVGAVATLALVAWALLEVYRGVNPFRRIVGGVVLVAQVAALLAR
ncbi:MAG TPA: hypothetical protein VGR61_02770 [Candidatus Dormibacteraeota bacterium]|nr:hypothetical protein [Candidatus Dormibacteraeota bacterium]